MSRQPCEVCRPPAPPERRLCVKCSEDYLASGEYKRGMAQLRLALEDFVRRLRAEDRVESERMANAAKAEAG